MHPRQASLLSQASEVKIRTATMEVVWQYTDEEGNEFFLTEKRVTIRSPYTGKSFTAHPQRYSYGQIVQVFKELSPIVWLYTDPNGNGDFILTEKKTTLKSPFTGMSFTTRPQRFTPTQLVLELKGRDLEMEALMDSDTEEVLLEEEEVPSELGLGPSDIHTNPIYMASEALKMAAKKKLSLSNAPKAPTQAILWKYEDPEGHIFYLEEKKTTIKSPFSGKSFSIRPTRHTPAQVGKDLKDEIKDSKAKTASDVWKA